MIINILSMYKQQIGCADDLSLHDFLNCDRQQCIFSLKNNVTSLNNDNYTSFCCCSGDICNIDYSIHLIGNELVNSGDDLMLLDSNSLDGEKFNSCSMFIYLTC